MNAHLHLIKFPKLHAVTYAVNLHRSSYLIDLHEHNPERRMVVLQVPDAILKREKKPVGILIVMHSKLHTDRKTFTHSLFPRGFIPVS